MNTYQFESVIEDKGIIVLPEQMKPLHKHRVRLILIDLGTFPPDPVQKNWGQTLTISFSFL